VHFRRRHTVFACVLLAFGCGGSGEQLGPPLLTVTNGAVRIRCFDGDCRAGIVRDGGAYYVAASRTVGDMLEQQDAILTTLTDVDIETGDGDDRVNLVDFGVPGRLRIATGAGNDSFDLCDAGALGDTRIDTGAGDDHASFAPGVYARRFTLYLGEGADTVSIEGGHFRGEVLIDGGAGEDREDVTSATFLTRVEVTGFEQHGLVSRGEPEPAMPHDH
jgi:hypothetical protein